MNRAEDKPLFTLTAGEFAGLVAQIIEQTVRKMGGTLSNERETEEETFTIRQLSDFLNCHRVSIYNYIKKGLPFYKVGRKMLFKKTEVLRFMQTLKNQ